MEIKCEISSRIAKEISQEHPSSATGYAEVEKLTELRNVFMPNYF